MSVSSPRFGRRLSAPAIPSVLFVFICLLPAPAAAQAAPVPARSHWGVTASFSPSAEAHEGYRELLYDFEGAGSVKSSEFTIGLVRGSTRGGDWGVSFVRKPLKDGSQATDVDTDCFEPTNCGTFTYTKTMRNVVLTGVEFHWAPTFVTLANRVQIGINIAGGIASASGDIEEVFINEFTDPNFPDSTDTIVSPAKEILIKPQPLGKVEVQGSVIATPAFKIRVAGGFNAPGYGVRFAAVYLIGAK
jgi:hypothetical protein